jgi:type II secretory pathway component GspD/PulD (secretin)
VVIDALIADVALSDSTPPGWELEKSRFGVVDAEPRSVLNSLRGNSRVHVIATNQLQVIDRQWASLEWTQGGSQPPESRSADTGASLHLATSFRLRPSILPGGLVRLEIHPTSSRRTQGVSPRPEVATLTFTTDLVLHSGATALISGTFDERMPESEIPAVSAKNTPRPADAPKIEPQPGVRRQTVLLLMPRVAGEN